MTEIHKTGIESYYTIRNNQRLRFGYTTGSCAAAASKAAAMMLLGGGHVPSVRLMTPKGIELDLEILDVQRVGADGADGTGDPAAYVSCAVRKDGGDDPDATDGVLVYARVERCARPEGREIIPGIWSHEGTGSGQGPRIIIDGGEGVGVVTRVGLKIPVGQAAINPMPRRMIRDEVLRVCEEYHYGGSLKVVISIPEGKAIAAKTFNPRLGIEGGLSVLGTSGIVVPMSERALIESIRLEMQMLVSKGHEYLLITPGNYGETFVREETSLDLSAALKCSNYVGETLDMAVDMGVKGILFVAHVGKFIKVAGGIMNTHSRDADARAELMAAYALRCGASRELAMEILESATTDEALGLMDREGVRTPAMELAAERVHYYLQHRVASAIETEAILFSSQYGYLSRTPGADELAQKLTAAN